MKILIIVALIVLEILMLFLYSACVISGRCSREEEKLKDEEELNEYNKRN